MEQDCPTRLLDGCFFVVQVPKHVCQCAVIDRVQGIERHGVLQNFGSAFELAIAVICPGQLPDCMAPAGVDLDRLFQRLHFRRMMISRLMDARQVNPESRQQWKTGRRFVGAPKRFFVAAHLSKLLNDGRVGVPQIGPFFQRQTQ